MAIALPGASRPPSAPRSPPDFPPRASTRSSCSTRTSSVLEKWPRRSRKRSVLVAVAKGFTEESRALLIERGAVIVSLGDFFWTDASYLAIKRR